MPELRVVVVGACDCFRVCECDWGISLFPACVCCRSGPVLNGILGFGLTVAQFTYSY